MKRKWAAQTLPSSSFNIIYNFFLWLLLSGSVTMKIKSLRNFARVISPWDIWSHHTANNEADWMKSKNMKNAHVPNKTTIPCKKGDDERTGKETCLPLVNNNHGSKLTVCKTAYWCEFHVLKLNASSGNETTFIYNTENTFDSRLWFILILNFFFFEKLFSSSAA